MKTVIYKYVLTVFFRGGVGKWEDVMDGFLI
jgi:hypothetical protein